MEEADSRSLLPMASDGSGGTGRNGIILISHVENPELVATKIIVPHHLVERESCAGAGWFCGD